MKALTPFPGLAFRGQVCGVVVACVMILGLKYGRETIDDWPGYIRSVPPVKAFYQRFEKKVGGILCAEVLGSVAGNSFASVEPAETKRWLDAGCIDKNLVGLPLIDHFGIAGDNFYLSLISRLLYGSNYLLQFGDGKAFFNDER